MRFVPKLLAGCVAAACVAFALAPTASGAQFLIDSNLSKITISGNIKATGVPVLGTINISKLVAQTGGSSPNSNILTLQGNLEAGISPGGLNFLGGDVSAVDHPLIQPNADGTAFTPALPGAVGLRGTASVLFSTLTVNAALRDLALGVTGFAPNGAPGQIGLGGLTLGIDEASLVYRVQHSLLNQGGATTVTNETSAFPAGNGTYVQGLLTIPVALSLVIEELDPEGISLYSTLNFNGQIVAQLVPEPGTLAMMGLGVIGLAVVGRRKFRKHLNR